MNSCKTVCTHISLLHATCLFFHATFTQPLLLCATAVVPQSVHHDPPCFVGQVLQDTVPVPQGTLQVGPSTPVMMRIGVDGDGGDDDDGAAAAAADDDDDDG